MLIEEDTKSHGDPSQILRPGDCRLDTLFDAHLPALLDLPHLPGVVVVVPEGVVHVGYIEIVAIGYGLGGRPAPSTRSLMYRTVIRLPSM